MIEKEFWSRLGGRELDCDDCEHDGYNCKTDDCYKPFPTLTAEQVLKLEELVKIKNIYPLVGTHDSVGKLEYAENYTEKLHFYYCAGYEGMAPTRTLALMSLIVKLWNAGVLTVEEVKEKLC